MKKWMDCLEVIRAALIKFMVPERMGALDGICLFTRANSFGAECRCESGPTIPLPVSYESGQAMSDQIAQVAGVAHAVSNLMPDSLIVSPLLSSTQ